MSAWLRKTLVSLSPADMSQSGFIAKQVPHLSDSYLARANCQEFVATHRDDGLPHAVDSPFCYTSVSVIVRQSTSPEDREIGRRFSPLWEGVSLKIQEIFTESDDKGNLVVLALDVWAQVLSVHDRRIGVGKQDFGLAPLGHELKFSINSPIFASLLPEGAVVTRNYMPARWSHCDHSFWSFCPCHHP